MRIAIVARDYASGKNFIQEKFKDKIIKMNAILQIYTLNNGDTVELCWGDPLKYDTGQYDAYLVAPGYVTLEDTIKYRTMRIP